MIKKQYTRYLATLLALPLLAEMAAAQTDITWEADPGTPADWSAGANWAGGFVPAADFNERAFITNGGTAFLDTALSGLGNAAGGLFVGLTSTVEIRNTGSLTLAERITDPILTDRSGLINGSLNVQGAGFIDGQNLTFGAQSMVDLDLTGSSNTPLRSTGTTFLGGTLNLDYSTIANPLGSQTLLEAGNISGAFATVNVTGLGPNQGVALGEVDPAEGNSTLEATVFNQLMLQVDRDTNNVTIINPHNTAVAMDGFAVQSAAGSLVGANFTGLGGSFAGGTPNDNVVSQLFEGGSVATPSFAFPANSSTVIGTDLFLRAAPPAFQADSEDLLFTFTAPNATAPFEGLIEYVGAPAPIDNDIVLTIDSSGQGALLNASDFPQEVEAYRITSSDGSLIAGTWDSLADQSVDGGIWSEAAFSGTNVLFELTEGDPGANDSTTFAFTPDGLFNLGTIFSTGGNPSGVVFEFLVEGGTEFTQGSVVFGDLPDSPPLIGDYNGDNLVNAADYTVWRDNLGGDGSALANRSPFSNGDVSRADYEAWRTNFGASLSASASLSAVPEPSGFIIAGLIMTTLFAAFPPQRLGG